MPPRERAQQRMARHIPGLDLGNEGATVLRIQGREVDHRPVRALPGDSVHVPVRGEVKRLRTADVSENAPQLIRLVRHPYALQTVRARRQPGFVRPDPCRPTREPARNPVAEMQEIRGEFTLGSPFAGMAHRPMVRPHPFAKARLRVSETEDGS